PGGACPPLLHLQGSVPVTAAQPAPPLPAWEWARPESLRVDGCEFAVGASALLATSSPTPGFPIHKSPDLLEAYRRLIDAERPRRIIELGIKDGGSTALIALTAQPEVLVGVDREPTLPEGLRSFVESRGLASVVRTRLGIDQ